MTTTAQPEPADKRELLEALRVEHRTLKERVSAIESNLTLTPEEQVECARLKKLKLATKDRIHHLERELNES